MKVNIPREVDDVRHRYKMPIFEVLMEGTDGSPKTRICNISDVAKALQRNPIHIINFFGIELNTQVTIEDGYLLKGHHDSEALMRLLDRFIAKYVLCKWCQKPDTEFFIKKQSLRLKCRLCGQRDECDPIHMMTNHIIQDLMK